MRTVLAPHQVVSSCRGCGANDLEVVVSFGETPLADRLVKPRFDEPEYIAPLTLALCRACGLCQILETVEPRVLFGPDYPYFSSVSAGLLKHFRQSAEDLIRKRKLTSGHLVIEAASNDGYMLDIFLRNGIGVLGIDPADGPVQEARKKGVETVHDFFGKHIASDLRKKGKLADVFLANNVLAHVADTNDFIAGIAELLSEDGVAVIEFPYLRDLVEHGEFDTIYHQHLLYLSLSPLKRLFQSHGLHLTDAERTSIHGGSLRIYVERKPGESDRLKDLLKEEASMGLSHAAYFDDFKTLIETTRQNLRNEIEACKKAGKKVAGYGAAAKATTLLHVCGLGKDELEFVADKSQWKHGLEMPVNRLPILPPSEIYAQGIDCVAILAWNFAGEIIQEHKAFEEKGGRFIVPISAVTE
ncbi:class I SAM-dependent methyltransferase [Ruegeria profundi]|uniref:class I SAM-dependent methyltransferase n=1 Tax=Ruegeria profundi TaxID=1685378 RepID=UPI001CD75ADE|nr:class I SAM-dependent methyltransferase [Ruegeria profundi]MCA0930685.1 class I SAM-dependent methyltransferase [Ruegeria profundi]